MRAMSNLHDPFNFSDIEQKEPEVIGLRSYIWLWLTDKSFREFMR